MKNRTNFLIGLLIISFLGICSLFAISVGIWSYQMLKEIGFQYDRILILSIFLSLITFSAPTSIVALIITFLPNEVSNPN